MDIPKNNKVNKEKVERLFYQKAYEQRGRVVDIYLVDEMLNNHDLTDREFSYYILLLNFASLNWGLVKSIEVKYNL